MSLIDYLDVEDATQTALENLSACRQEYERLPVVIAGKADQIRQTSHSMEQRPSDHKAAKLEALREQHAALLERLAALEEYLLYFAACWDHLEQWERDSLHCRFVNRSLGIKTFMAQYHICRADAYRKSDAALKRLAKLLYW